LNFLPVKFAICNEIFRDWKLEDAFAYAAQAGYDGIEIAPFTIADSVSEISSGERQKIRDVAARNKIEIAGIHWVLVTKNLGSAGASPYHVNHPDASIRERTARYFVELVDFCADVGGKVMVVGSPKQRNILPGVSHDQAWDWATETFRDAAKRAEERSVTICFEPLSTAETNFVNTAAEAIRFAQQFNSPNFKIILDVKAMCGEAESSGTRWNVSLPKIIRKSWPHFAHFHANDKNLKGPGFGEVDFKPIVQALKKVGYDGFVSVEVFNFDEGAEVIATKSIDYLRRTFGCRLEESR
jgi:sugar phosphate isomerase/epimerase